jgi:hypothetical protein
MMSAVVWASAPTHNPPNAAHKYRLSVSFHNEKMSDFTALNSPVQVVWAPLT